MSRWNFHSQFERTLVHRPTHSVPSIHHQTLLSKSLFEHGPSLAFIACVAMSSKSIQNSSLSPNFLGSITIDEGQLKLFQTVFHPSTSLPVQFVQNIFIETCDTVSHRLKLMQFVKDLKETKYFHKSLRRLTCDSCPNQVVALFIDPPSSDKNRNSRVFTSLEELALERFVPLNIDSHIDGILNHLPNLKKIHLGCPRWSGYAPPDVFRLVKMEVSKLGSRLISLSLTQFEDDRQEGTKSRELLEADNFLSSLTRLEKLSLARSGFNGYGPTANFCCRVDLLPSTLTDLDLRFVRFENCPAFAKLVKLRKLVLAGTITSDEILVLYISEMEILTELDVSDCSKVTDIGILSLAQQNTALKILKLDRCEAIHFDLVNSSINAHFNNNTCSLFPNLVELHLSRCNHLAENIFASIQALKSLTCLHLARSRIDDDMFFRFLRSPMPTLLKLNLSGNCSLTDVAISFVATFFNNLTELDLSGCDEEISFVLVDAGLSFLSETDDEDDEGENNNVNDNYCYIHFPELTSLLFDCGGISQEGCQVIAKSRKLRELSLQNVESISDECLTVFHHHPSLWWLNLEGTRTSSKGRVELKATLLPSATILASRRY